MNPIVKKLLHSFGASLGFAGVIFIVIRLHHYSGQLDLFKFGPNKWIVIIILAIFYGSANYLLAVAWFYILGFLKIRVSKNWAVKTYGISQLAKYIPGNIFQFAGRQAIGLAADLPGVTLAKSVFWELALISIAGALFILPAAASILTELTILSEIFILLSVFITASFCLWRIIDFPVLKIFICQLFFLLVAGLVFVCTLSLVIGTTNLKPELIIMYAFAYIVAWLAGLITPGAPAGVGVRELMLVFLLGTKVAQTDILIAVILNRFITVTGDGGFFLWATLLKKDKT